MSKICSKCRVLKDESEFRLINFRVIAQCKICEKKSTRQYRQTVEGKAKHLVIMHRYLRSSLGQTTTQQYLTSDRGRLSSQQRSRRRREKKAKLDLAFTDKDQQIVYDRFNNQCFHCRSTDRLEIDHHYPLAHGHGLTLINAVLLCRNCNSSKGSKTPEEFYTADQLKQLSLILGE